MTSGGSLFLDLATSTGWAYGVAGGRPSWGVWKLPGHISHGASGAALETALDDFIEQHRPSAMGYEAPLAADQQTDATTAFVLIGLAFLVETTAHRWSIPCRAYRSDMVRGAVIGRSKLTDDERQIRPKTNIKKAIVLPWVAQQGWAISEHDAADAAVGWAYMAGIRHPQFGKRKG